MNASFDGLPPLRSVIGKHGLSARKSLGQNFLLDFNLLSRIVRESGSLAECDALEIGPGPGGLTRAMLAAGARRVVAVERDPRCLSALEEIAENYPGRLEVVEADAMKIDAESLVEKGARIICNPPYNIATRLVARWIGEGEWPPFWRSMTLTLQKEVAQRLCAQAGRKAYGRLSVLAGWRTNARIAFDLPAEAFTPSPKVDSSVAILSPRESPAPCDAEKLQAVTAAAFGQRRKTLRRALESLGGEALLERAGISGGQRAEKLDPEQFARLANAL